MESGSRPSSAVAKRAAKPVNTTAQRPATVDAPRSTMPRSTVKLLENAPRLMIDKYVTAMTKRQWQVTDYDCPVHCEKGCKMILTEIIIFWTEIYNLRKKYESHQHEDIQQYLALGTFTPWDHLQPCVYCVANAQHTLEEIASSPALTIWPGRVRTADERRTYGYTDSFSINSTGDLITSISQSIQLDCYMVALNIQEVTRGLYKCPDGCPKDSERLVEEIMAFWTRIYADTRDFFHDGDLQQVVSWENWDQWTPENRPCENCLKVTRVGVLSKLVNWEQFFIF